MGSDFTYSDIEGVDVNDYDYQFIKQSEVVNGYDTWVIERTPKTKLKKQVIQETGYLKSQIWIRKDIFMVVKAKHWVKKGKKLKFFNASEIENIDGIWTAKQMQMATTKKGRKEHATVLQFQTIEYNHALQDDLFSVQNMERGIII